MKSTSFLVALALAACGDGQAETTVVTTVVTTATNPTDPQDTDTDETSSTTDETTEAPGTSNPTTGVDETTTTSTTSSPPQDCHNDGTMCPPAPAAESFCAYVAESCASHGIEPLYCEIVNNKCDDARAVDECQVCFSLENYCSQIGTDCDGLMTECICAHQALEGGE